MKVKRSYSSPRREEQAARTKAAILVSARSLFVDLGYGATSIRQIAHDAGVAVQTVYSVFGNKMSVLDQLLDVSIVGDDQAVAVNDRDWMHTVFSDPDAATRLAAYASAVAGIYRRAGDVFSVVQAAAHTDTDLHPLAKTSEQRRRSGARSVVDGLNTLGALRQDLGVDRATDILWTLNSPDLFRRLVRECGWPVEDYEHWLAEAMVDALLNQIAS